MNRRRYELGTLQEERGVRGPLPLGYGPGAAKHANRRAENLTAAGRVQYGEEREPPGLGEAMGGIARRIKDNFSLTWRWFNYWRRRYVWLRLVIILLVFAHPVYGVFRPMIRDLVVVAIKGIEGAKFGPRLEARAFQHLEKKRLQTALLARFDEDEDGRLDRDESAALEERTGLTPAEVEGSALDVELDPLVEASHEVGLLPRTTTARDFRREALATALAQRDQEHEALWEEAGAYLEMPYPTLRDYLRWETWRRGLRFFGQVVSGSTTSVPVPTEYFAGLRSPVSVGPIALVETEPEPWWQGLIGWAALLILTAVCIRRYGKGLELQRRFREDSQLAAAPCPVCGEATNDYGALRQHRFSRACATAAVVGLVYVAVGDLRPPDWLYGVGIVAIPVAGIVRWTLWPREIHACHRRPSFLYLGFAATLLLVAGLVSGIAAYGMNTFGYPRERRIVVGMGPGEAVQRTGRRPPATVEREATPAPRAASPSRRGRQPSATGAQPRQSRGRGMRATRDSRSAGARQRTSERDRRAGRRPRRSPASEGPPGR